MIAMIDDVVSVLLGPKFLNLRLRSKDQILIRKINLFNDWATSYAKKRVEEEEKKIRQLGDKYEASDIISSLVLINQKSEGEKPYSIEDIIAELKTFFLAGIETTSSLFMAMIFYVYKNPDVLEKLREEINSKVKGEIIFEGIKQMAYLEAIQNESLRLMGPANGIIPRKATCDHIFAGANIRKDTYV